MSKYPSGGSMTIPPDATTRYLAALSKFMENDQPTIEQHREFVDAMRSCAADYTTDRDSYLRMAEMHEMIIKEKMEMQNEKNVN